MKKITGFQRIKVEAEVENVTEFHDRFPCTKIMEIDGKPAEAVCESCECAISKGDQCYSWNEFVFTCLSCGGYDENHKPITL